MRGDYQKPLKKLTLIFLSNPDPLNGKVFKNKKGLELVTSRSSGYETSSQKLLSDLVWWCNWKWFLSYSKNYTCKFMQVNSWHLNYSTSICPFESGNYGKKEEKLQKSEYLQNKKTFLEEIKNIFHSFWRLIIWWKNENLIKISEHKL